MWYAKLRKALRAHADQGWPSAVQCWLDGFRRGQSYRQVIDQVNRFVNKLVYVREAKDEWDCPFVFWMRGYGDCEEFALMKCLLLKELGVRSWFAICWDRQAQLWHAVCLVKDDKDRFLVLDRNPPFNFIRPKATWIMAGVLSFEDPDTKEPLPLVEIK